MTYIIILTFDFQRWFQEVKDTLDKGAIFRCMTLCYEAHQSEKPSLDDLSPTEDESVLKSARSLAVIGGSILQGFVVWCNLSRKLKR